MKPMREYAEKFKDLRVLNNILTVIVVMLAVYIISAPLLPQVSWYLTQESPAKRWLSNTAHIQEKSDGAITDNRLFIPELGLEEVIHEGGLGQLKNGVLRLKNTSTPDAGSNTVLVGHRFMYSEKGVFYHLDKVKLDDQITIHWNSDKYNYQVSDISVVKPDALSVEAATDDDILTIYTCTPLWTSKERLVVRARLTGANQ